MDNSTVEIGELKRGSWGLGLLEQTNLIKKKDSMCGDNINFCHKMKTLEDSPDVLVAYCVRCKFRTHIRKDRGGRPEPKYNTIFRRDTLQPNSNLYYKEYPNRMKIA